MESFLSYCAGRRSEMVGLIHKLVELESPSGDKPSTDRCARFLARALERRGARLKRHTRLGSGDQIEAHFLGEGPRSRPILLLGHYDTVWETGTLERMPWRERSGRLYGPGVFDMKAGIVLMLFALDGLRRRSGRLPCPVIVSLNGDEETGSVESRTTTERLARSCRAVLVLEPAQGTSVKTARKGVGGFTLRVTGVAAHAGLDLGRGHNAVLEMARQIERVSAFTNLKRGVTVTVGVVRGGTRRNVVPAEACAEIDVRIRRAQDGPLIARRLAGLRPVDPGCRVQVSGGMNRPPLERTRSVASLYHLAQSVAAGLGFDLPEAAVGGGSDGNFTGALGVPTLDGLGAVGEGAHATNESVVLSWLPKRAALLAGLIEAIAHTPTFHV